MQLRKLHLAVTCATLAVPMLAVEVYSAADLVLSGSSQRALFSACRYCAIS